ncbi:MAG: hypothetical protein WC655_25040 [Candidatus Hydrogenedentales bacterium]
MELLTLRKNPAAQRMYNLLGGMARLSEVSPKVTVKKNGCRRLFYICFAGVIVLVALLGFVVLPWFAEVVERLDFKGNAPYVQQSPIERLRSVAPEAQLESHTCGLLTLRAIYKAYGMDPDKSNLRVRLGVDVPANPFDSESIGTMQPDILRVVVQDGFDYTILRKAGDTARELLASLGDNHMAAALIRRRQNGHLHWVALQYDSPTAIKVIDSLATEPYSEPIKPFMDECLLSCVILSPAKKTRTEQELKADVQDAEFDGLAELASSVEDYLFLREMDTHDEASGAESATGKT